MFILFIEIITAQGLKLLAEKRFSVRIEKKGELVNQLYQRKRHIGLEACDMALTHLSNSK